MQKTLYILVLICLSISGYAHQTESSKSINEDFYTFEKRFVSDAEFQMSRIIFDNLGYKFDDDPEAERIKYSPENWNLFKTTLSEVRKAGQYQTDMKLSRDKCVQRIWLRSSSFALEYTYTKIKGKWFLTKVFEGGSFRTEPVEKIDSQDSPIKDVVEDNWWFTIKKWFQKDKYSLLAKLGIGIFLGAVGWFVGGLAAFLSFGSNWWIGLLFLLGLLLFIALYAVAYYYYEQYDMELSTDKQSTLSWLMLVYVIWGMLSCVVSYISTDFAYNVGHFWVAENTSGLGGIFAVGLTWIVLILTLIAIRLCYVNTEPPKRKIRLILLILINIYSFIMGAFLTLLIVIGITFFIAKILFSGNAKSYAMTSYQAIYDHIVIGVDGLIRSAKSLGGNRFEDKEGNTYKQTSFNEFEKEE